jgi:two-component system, sensor histidine kinase FlrB
MLWRHAFETRGDERGVGPDPALSAGVLGVRLLALSAVAGAAVLLPAERVDRGLLVSGVTAGAALGFLQDLAIRRGHTFLASCLLLPQVSLWAQLIHATGGRASPLVLGYLLELPLAGLLFGSIGMVAAPIAVLAASLLFPESVPSSNRGPELVLWWTVVAAFAVLSASVVAEIRRRRERRVEAMREELRDLSDSLSGALLAIDGGGRIESLNPAGARLLGRHGNVVGKPWQEVLEVDRAARGRILDTLASGAAQRDLSVTVELADGRKISLRAEIWSARVRTYVLLQPQDSPPVEDPVRQLGEAAASVAHQIKNSVHALQGMMEEVDRSQRAGAALGEYREGLRSLGALAEDVLAFSGSARVPREALSLQDATRAAAVLLGNAPIRVCLPPAPLMVTANRGQLVHAIFNLLDNARRVTPPGRCVEVRGRREGAWVTLEILDRGPGISPAVANARGPVSSETGTGLGLATARRFVEDNCGSLTLAPAEGGGTICRLALEHVT